MKHDLSKGQHWTLLLDWLV